MSLLSRRSLLIAAAAVIGTPAFAKKPPQPEPPSEFNRAWGTLFVEQNALKLVNQCSRQSPGPVQGFWTPTPIQVGQLEGEFFPLLQAELKKRGAKDLLASDYYRQYGGLVIGEHRIVYINGFHRQVVEKSPNADTWKTTAVGICDGGELAFGVEYNPQLRTFENFRFNGKL